MRILSPICIFVYNRIFEIQQTIEALQKNYLAAQSDVIIFSDGAKNNDEDREMVSKVRQYIHSISGFKTVKIIESNVHKGLAPSIISGVTKIINQHEKIIVLEDDLVTAPNFLDFMNEGLDFYANDQKIFNINGYSMELKSLNGYLKDYYLVNRASSWGWGTWKNRWNKIDWEVKDYNRFKYNLKENIKFMRGGSDMPFMLWKQRKGIIESWAIRWCYHQFKNGQLSVSPAISKIINIGIGEQATNTKKTKRFKTKLDEGSLRNFTFDQNPQIDPNLIKEFKHQHSVLKRIGDHI